MGKIAGRIIFVIAIAFVAYMLITGQIAIAWERVIIYVLFAVGISVAAEIRAKKQKKQDEEYFREHPQEKSQGKPQGNSQGDALWKSVSPTAAEGAGSAVPGAQGLGDGAVGGAVYGMNAPEGFETVQGVVRMPTGLRGIINFLLAFIWLMILVCTALAAADGAFSDLDTIGAFGALFAVGAGFTVLMTGLLNHFLCDIYYTSHEVTVKKGRRKISYRWNDIGGYKQTNYLYAFQDREGRKIFTTNCSYEGFDGFMDQYRRTHIG